MVKMLVNLAEKSESLDLNQLEHSILRNFGGFDPDKFNPLNIFKQYTPNATELARSDDGIPPVDPMGLIKSSLSGEHTSFKGFVLGSFPCM